MLRNLRNPRSVRATGACHAVWPTLEFWHDWLFQQQCRHLRCRSVNRGQNPFRPILVSLYATNFRVRRGSCSASRVPERRRTHSPTSMQGRLVPLWV